MYWVKDYAGDLVNLARAHEIRSGPVVKDSRKHQVSAWFGSDASDGFECILRVGTPGECRAFRDNLFLKLKEAQDSDRV